MLVNSLNQLHEAMLNREAKEVIGGIIKGLYDYIGVHFSDEESQMQKYDYPEYSEHKKTHHAFVQKVGEFQTKFEEGELMLSMQVTIFLKDWLKSHIKGTDQSTVSSLAKKAWYE